MINLLLPTLAILTLFYLFCILILYRGLFRLKPGTSPETPFVSVVVAARNEEKNITQCIESLRRQTWQLSRFEIIVVNDRSEDQTAEQVSRMMPGCPNLKLINITRRQSGVAPKKYALSRGIEKAHGEIILTTDADCRPSPDWIKTMVSYFDINVGIVAGFSPLEIPGKPPALIEKIYALESLSLACVAAAGIGLSRPLTCSGRNFAYRKQVYQEVGGFDKIAHHISGDDDLFLHLVANQTTWRIRYAIDPEGLVYTVPPDNFDAFKNQRTRHASKGKHYQPALVTGLILVYLFNFMLFSGWTWFPFISIKLTLAACLAFLLKSSLEYIFLLKGARIFNKRNYLNIFPLAAVLHIPYVVIFGLLGTFKTFRWKGEVFEAQEQNNSNELITGN